VEIVFDFSTIQKFLALPPDQIVLRLFFTVGWIPVAIMFLWGFKEIWMYYIQGKWGATQKFILLAIDVPRGNQQDPKAVENIITYLAGAHGTLNLIDKYWDGKYQLSMSLEIVSIDGYTQFLMHIPEHFRNLAESAIYSQYPDAEITEVNDYTEGIPNKFPDEEYDIWGAEFIQAKSPAYPIKMYEDFIIDRGVPEETFKDPMGSLMDLCSSLVKGEQLWNQIIITPLPFDGELEKMGDKEINKILGKSSGGNKTVEKIIQTILDALEYFSEMVYKLWGDIEKKKDDKQEDMLRMMNLTPKQKKQIEAITEKVSKLSYEFKNRFIYIAKKEVKNNPKVVNGFVGYMKQFVHMDLNNLKPDSNITMTSTAYFAKESRLNARKNKIMQNYKARSVSSGRSPGIINIEEIATLWHFPVEAVVKAPLIQKTPGRKAEAPMTLPTEDDIAAASAKNQYFESEDIFSKGNADYKEQTKLKVKSEELNNQNKKALDSPPDNLPFV